MKGRNLAASVLVVVLFAAGGCLFEPRTAEKPSGGDDACWIVPNTPTDVFLNLNCGLASAGNSSYDRSVSSEFTFIPRPGYDGPGNFEEWDKDEELDVITRIKGDYQGERSMQFGKEDGTWEDKNIEVQKAWYKGPYYIRLNRGDGSDEEIFAGKAIFYVEQTTKGWVLAKWEDIDIIGSYPTSANIRGASQE